MDRENALRKAALSTIVVPREKALHLFNPHFLRYVQVPPLVELFSVPAEFLLSATRFDIVAKSIYGRQKQSGMGSRWSEDLYAEHLRAFNGYHEDDGNKHSREDFITGFQVLLESISENGFRDSISVVPIGADNGVVDGSHRVAAALAYGKTVTVARFPDISVNYDYLFFRKRGFGSSFMDASALEFCCVYPGCRMFILWPSAKGNSEGTCSILNTYGAVLYSKEVVLSHNGALNLVRHIYAKESWLGDYDNGFAGGLAKVKQCFCLPEPVRVFLVGGLGESETREAKNRIRQLFGIGNDSVHSADSHEESLGLAQAFFNDNSIHLLNHRVAGNLKHFEALLGKFKEVLKNQCIDPDSFCIDTGGVLAAYGLREPTDLDYLSCSTEPIAKLPEEISDHDSQLCYHQYAKDDIVFDPRNHFFYHGIKFASLRVVRAMKRARGETKDWHDIVLIDRTMDVLPITIFCLRLLLLGKWVSERLASRVQLKLRNARGLVAEYIAPFIRTIPYCDYDVFYSRGTSIVSRIHEEGCYEAQTCNVIARELSHFDNPVFLDVGANIGLISIKVLASVPGVVIHAFEPGDHQYQLFKKTIEKNSLEAKIYLYNEALGDVSGARSFSVHNSRDASGDGFIDTGRAGKADTVTVNVTTLDSWTERSGVSPEVIKIDTEGAELWVLQGGQNYIREKKPIIFLEISTKNLQAYPYSYKEILTWFYDRAYRLFTIDGIALDEVSMVRHLDEADIFIARPE